MSVKKLTKAQKMMLVTMYLMEVKEISVQFDDLALHGEDKYFNRGRIFLGSLPFVSDELSLIKLKDESHRNSCQRFNLAELIRTYCPEYEYVIGRADRFHTVERK